MPALSNARDAMAPEVIPSASIWVTTRTAVWRVRKSAILEAVASMPVSDGRKLIKIAAVGNRVAPG